MAICVYCGGRGTHGGFDCPMCHGSGEYPYVSLPPLVNSPSTPFIPTDEDNDEEYEEEEDLYWYTQEGINEFIDNLAEQWREDAGEYLDRDKYDHEYVPIWNGDLVREYERDGWINLGIQPGFDDYYQLARRKR
jgi:hypothetical protein